MVAVNVGPRPWRPRRDRVFVDRIGSGGILVADLDHHPPADRIQEDFAVGGPKKETAVLCAHLPVHSFSSLVFDGVSLQ
jgi:hypothetical protein